MPVQQAHLVVSPIDDGVKPSGGRLNPLHDLRLSCGIKDMAVLVKLTKSPQGGQRNVDSFFLAGGGGYAAYSGVRGAIGPAEIAVEVEGGKAMLRFIDGEQQRP